MRKESLQRVIDALPDEVDFDALMEKLYLMYKVEVAEQQLAEGRDVSHEEAKQQLKSWLG